MKITERIYDLTTDKTTEIERTLTDKEVSANQVIQAELEKLEAETEQAAADKAALLTKLGITADEFKTLLGGN